MLRLIYGVTTKKGIEQDLYFIFMNNDGISQLRIKHKVACHLEKGHIDALIGL